MPILYGDIDRPNFLAALSLLLSRPEATPLVLSDDGVEKIAAHSFRVFRELRRQGNSAPTSNMPLWSWRTFSRVRERDPWALLAARSKVARALVEELPAILAQIRIRPRAITNEAQMLQIVSELVPLLSAESGGPDILDQIRYQAQDSEQETLASECV